MRSYVYSVEILQIDNIHSTEQEGLAVASIAQNDPFSLPGMHCDHNALPSQTDGQTHGH